jgi:hypothetical protein
VQNAAASPMPNLPASKIQVEFNSSSRYYHRADAIVAMSVKVRNLSAQAVSIARNGKREKEHAGCVGNYAQEYYDTTAVPSKEKSCNELKRDSPREHLRTADTLLANIESHHFQVLSNDDRGCFTVWCHALRIHQKYA